MKKLEFSPKDTIKVAAIALASSIIWDLATASIWNLAYSTDIFLGLPRFILALPSVESVITVSSALTFIISWIILKLNKIKHNFFIALFSILIIISLYVASRTSIPFHIFPFLFIGIFEFIYLTFNFVKIKVIFPLIISVIISAFCWFYVVPFGLNDGQREFDKNSQTKLSTSGIQLYVLKKGKFEFETYDFNYHYNPSFVTLVFSNELVANVYKTPNYYNPPKVCGQDHPTIAEQSINISCEFAGKTKKGISIYQYRQENSNHIEHYFGRINDTVITLTNFPAGFTKNDAFKVYDSFEPVTLDELNRLNKKAINDLNNKKIIVAQYVDFDIYAPTYLPPGVKIKIYGLGSYLGNASVLTHPDMVINLEEKGATDNSGLTITEFTSKRLFNPPEDCGGDSTEFEDKYGFPAPCKLLVTTPKGIKIYTDNLVANFTLGATKISIPTYYTPFGNTSELTKVVDSMKKVPLEQIDYKIYR